METDNEKEELVFEVLIEIPKGSRNKYEFDKKRRLIKLDRMLFSSVHYPSDYGYFPETLALDGDPLDALVLVFKMRDEKGPDEKILCVPVADPMWNYLQTLDDVPPHLLREIEHFFTIYKDLEKKKTGVEGWNKDLTETFRIIKESQERYTQNQE